VTLGSHTLSQGMIKMQYRISTLAINSITYAMKAQDILTRSGIASSIVRLHPEQTPTGCAYGLEINGYDLGKATSLLKNAGVAFRLVK
jgi:hypothetical protein